MNIFLPVIVNRSCLAVQRGSKGTGPLTVCVNAETPRLLAVQVSPENQNHKGLEGNPGRLDVRVNLENQDLRGLEGNPGRLDVRVNAETPDLRESQGRKDRRVPPDRWGLEENRGRADRRDPPVIRKAVYLHRFHVRIL